MEWGADEPTIKRQYDAYNATLQWCQEWKCCIFEANVNPRLLEGEQFASLLNVSGQNVM
jgi:hypothetical protein